METTNRGTRAASLGLAVVVLCLAALAIFTAYTARTEIDRATRAEALANSYRDGLAVFQAQERLKLRLFLDPSAESAVRVEQAGRDMAEALSQIAITGGQEDAELAREMLALHDDYLAATERLLGAVAAGDIAQAWRIDENLAQPYFVAMQDNLTAAAEKRVAEGQAALAALAARAQWLLIAVPLVFLIGFVLLLGLWRIPADQLEKIFERYSRIETTHNIQGTGLGLSIVRQIVDLFDGKVWATSGSGDGSVFHVLLPLPGSASLRRN